MNSATFAILISTKNRKEDLFFTLTSICNLVDVSKVACVVFDDGSSDGTFQMVQQQFPNVVLHRNEISKGYLYCRNFMLNATQAKYAISLDDDAHFLSEYPMAILENYFDKNPNCGVIAFRIFWSKDKPNVYETSQTAHRVKGFVGCGHVWRMSAWKQIPNYPEWFEFYGEEEFASYQLFKKKIQVHYLPSVLVNHRVNVVSRKSQTDYIQRQRRSLRSGWYLYFLFYPLKVIPKKIGYSLFMQIKSKTFRGDFKATFGIIQAIFDVVRNLPKLLKQSNRLTHQEYLEIEKLAPTQVYWQPENEK